MSGDLPKLTPTGARLLTKADFAIPALALTGDGEPDKLYMAIGMALSHWEAVERQLADLYAILLQTRSLAAHRSLGALISAAMRMDAIEAAADITLQDLPDRLSDVARLIKVIREAAARRNEIAHGSVSNVNANGLAIGCVLMPTIFNPRKMDILGVGYKYRYNTDIVSAFSAKFHLLYAQLFDFNRALDYDLPPPSPHTIRGPGP